jgi:hypothetical protein
VNIGVVILAQTVHDRARMYGWLAASKPDLCVVCDETDVATRVKMAAPGAIVAHRWTYSGDGSVATVTPGEWVARFAHGLPSGVIGYALNEPSGDWRRIAAWCADVMSIAATLNRPVVVGNFAVGNPPQEAIEAGELDALLLAFNDFPLHYLGVHEYFRDKPHAEPWFVGRWKMLADRADRIGARGVRFLVTEAGRDFAGGANDGWQAVMSAEEYALKLTAQADRYQGANIPMAVFCYGEGGAGAWKTFDIQDAPPVLNAITAYNAAGNGNQEDDVVPWGLKQVKTKSAGAKINLRAEPKLTAPVLRTVQTGDWLRPYGTPVNAENHRWQRVNDEDCRTGWVSLNVIEFV